MSVERVVPLKQINKNRIITITGISGSGKDYLVDSAKQKALDIFGKGIEIFRFGAQLLDSINRSRPDDQIESRDLLKYLSPMVLDQFIQMTLEDLLRQQPALCLTHVVSKQQGRLVINPKSERFVNGQGYIFIRSNPELIQRWRANGQHSRQREVEHVYEIDIHQNIAQLSTQALAMSLGMGFMIINNEPDDTESSVNAIIESATSLV